MGRWNPWGALRQRTHVLLRWTRLDDVDGRMWLEPGGGAVIELDERLLRAGRNATLAHELVHEERGGGIDFDGAPATWRAVVAREELLVDREVARRLVPLDELAGLLRARASLGEAVTTRDVADEFDVPEWVARIALTRGERP